MSLTQVKTAGIAADAVTGAKIADNAVDSEHYVDGSIDNAHVADDQINSEHYAAASIDHEHLADDCVDGDNIADNSVGLAHMAGGTDGVIITYDASGDPVHVGPGNDGQVLTSTGAGSPPAFEDLPSSGVTVSNNVNNRVVTGDGTNLNAEAGLTCDGTHLSITDGNLVIGTSGHGIDFSATSDGGTSTSELFDDYEEGTWVPTCANSVTLDSGQDLARYCKIGRVVHLGGQLRINSSNSNQNFIITNLPFASAPSDGESSGEQYWLCSTYNLNHDADSIGIRLQCGAGTQNANLIDVKDDGGYNAVPAEDGNYVILGGAYFAAT